MESKNTDVSYQSVINNINERKRAYEENSDILTRVRDKKIDFSFDEMQDFVYKLYPTFFLEGYQIAKQYIIIDINGSISIQNSPEDHHPSIYSYELLSGFINVLRRYFKWNVTYEQSAHIIDYCQADFSKAFLKKFPRVVRVYTSSESKRIEYRKFQQGVEFAYLEFQEIQGTVQEIVLDKTEQLRPPGQGDCLIVDDTAVEFSALGGAPGPYIKDFVKTVGYEKITTLLEKLEDSTAHIHIAICVKYIANDKKARAMVHARFPVVWGQTGLPGEGYDPYIFYKGRPYLDGNPDSSPRRILLFWMWHKYWRTRDNL